MTTDSPWAALWIAWKKGPTLNEIYLETRRWSFLLTDDMIPGHELYEKQSRRLGLNWWISRSGLRITRSVFLLSFTFGQLVVVQNTYRSTLVGCKVRDIESTRFGPKKLDIDAALARKSCATKPNHRCQHFTRNRSTVSTISRRANRREIFMYSTSNGSFILQPRPEQSNARV